VSNLQNVASLKVILISSSLVELLRQWDCIKPATLCYRLCCLRYCCSWISRNGFTVGLRTLFIISRYALTRNSSLYMWMTPKSGAGLHKILLRSVMEAPQRFFDETDSGITLNRFSQDMTLIDGSLPSSAVIFQSCKLRALCYPRNLF
jgi:hypothetical protein